jgi:transcription-repair coupling factor (superfamily II helicase)
MLSRFRTDKEQKIIVEKVKSGAIDVIIGTRRLLSKDVGFKDLGLLVIDEEQRFGVKHKETIKELRSHVDVLALSATPIPRTLHMSLTGIRDMSLIEDPPEERYPVQTYVLEEDELAIQEAIRKELKRGGQVYAVYNRVRGILRVARQLNKLVPEARLAVGHGQMNEGALEDVMLGFVEGEKDILLSTTIIEAGLDIPNVNTILILEADHYGLSQLYQLRGRVGRSNRLAYAYLFYRRGKTLSEAAEKRLRAIREFTELGAGFKVSMRDLEIRGAGNLLGTQQSGHMMTVGYELYIRLLEEAILTLQGKPIPAEKQDTSVELKASAYIPTEYVPDEVLKLEMYKKIADADTREEMAELEEEMKDRFGDVPATVTTLLMISLIRSLAEELAITRITEEKGKILFYVAQENPIEPIGYARLYETFGNRVEIGGRVKPLIKLATDEKQKLGDTLAFLEILKGL